MFYADMDLMVTGFDNPEHIIGMEEIEDDKSSYGSLPELVE